MPTIRVKSNKHFISACFSAGLFPVDLLLFTSRFYCEGNLCQVVFLLYFLEKQDQFSLGSSSSSCFPPPPLVRPGSVYCLGEYFMALASHPQYHSLTLLLADHMNK